MEILKPLIKMMGTALSHAVPSFLVNKNGLPMGDPLYPLSVIGELTAVEHENTETSKTAVGSWSIIPTNAKGVLVEVDATGAAVSANVEYTLDRAGATANTTTTVENWMPGAITNKVDSDSIEAVAAVRMTDIVTNAISEVKSSMTTALVGVNNDIVYTSKLTGTAGDAITVAYLNPAMESQSLDVVVTGTAIEVYLATNDQNGGEIISTADEVKIAVAAKAEAHALVGTADKSGDDGSGVVTAMVATTLANGVNAVAATLPKMLITVV